MKKLFLLSFFMLSQLVGFEKVVIWGHKLHSHTHSYIHNAFYLAFKQLGYQTYWFDDQDDVSGFDFSDSLFITEGQVDKRIPVRTDCKYVLHNCDGSKYQVVSNKNRFSLQVYTDDVLARPSCVKIEPCIYYDVPGRCLYIPWATDLLPFEIDEVIQQLDSVKHSSAVYWIGTIGGGEFGNDTEINPFKQACLESGHAFLNKSHLSVEENKSLIASSYMAPTIVGAWQAKVGYIPCRIFKNISYGQMGITNSKRVAELFEGRIVYNPDTYALFYDAQKKINAMSREELIDLMNFVKTKHTYLNRIETILDFFDRIQNSD